MRERRTSVRHQLKWKATIEGSDRYGIDIDEEGVIENLSATGAFLYISKAVSVGAKLSLAIRLPLKRENWMVYTAEVVRVESADSGSGIAIKFDTIKPRFITR